MKTIAAIFATATLAMPAFAGGMSTPVTEPEVVAAAPVYAAPSADWSGFYAGAQLGYGDVSSSPDGLGGNGELGGLHAGYRWDFGQFVAGAEVDWDKTNIDLGGDAGSLDDVARLKLIGGADLGRALVYGSVGMAKANATVGGEDLSDTGYTLGAGVDYAITDSWTVGGELMGHQFNDFDGSGVDIDATTIKAKVALRF
ncbi:outer membrane protein [Tabrizicola sp. BL-A-41-H6]|uniref:outer membrane protein n=1 Tax=Tabrizicola sp. BL-A-41-H6 TaxID=3421107 RepID=UPI003D66C22C